MPTATRVDPREAFLQKHAIRKIILPPKAVEDLKYYDKRRKEGVAISFSALRAWIEQEYGAKVGRTFLYNFAKANSIEPWWSH